MSFRLIPHPDTPCAAVASIAAGASRSGMGLLALRYGVTGALGELHLPPPAASRRVDELWRRTCFEAFVKAGEGEAYLEFNFAPSTEWAAYRFDRYREGMRAAGEIGQPRIEVETAADRFELRVELDLSALPSWPIDAPWRLGLSAVIEAADGARSYWALAHPPGQADFHHPSGFAIELPWTESA
jgi:hypothetical protein